MSDVREANRDQEVVQNEASSNLWNEYRAESNTVQSSGASRANPSEGGSILMAGAQQINSLEIVDQAAAKLAKMHYYDNGIPKPENGNAVPSDAKPAAQTGSSLEDRVRAALAPYAKPDVQPMAPSPWSDTGRDDKPGSLTQTPDGKRPGKPLVSPLEPGASVPQPWTPGGSERGGPVISAKPVDYDAIRRMVDTAETVASPIVHREPEPGIMLGMRAKPGEKANEQGGRANERGPETGPESERRPLAKPPAKVGEQAEAPAPDRRVMHALLRPGDKVKTPPSPPFKR